jgi:Tol biopolymer transport system component
VLLKAGLITATAILFLTGCFSDPVSGPDMIAKIGTIRKLTQMSGNFAYPDWSEAGDKILCADNSPGSGNTKIIIIPAEGGEPDELYLEKNAGIRIYFPTWMPGSEGRSFVYLTIDEVESMYEIHLAEPDKSPQSVYQSDRWTYALDVTSDGESILFTSGTYDQEIIRLDVATKEAATLKTDMDSPLVNSISCDRTGDTISLTMLDTPSELFNLFQVPVLGGTARRITDFTQRGFSVDDAELSPDGQQYVIHTSQRIGSFPSVRYYYDFYLFPAGGGELIQLLDFPNEYSLQETSRRSPRNPTWSPDGGSIAFDFAGADDPGRRIYVIDL